MRRLRGETKASYRERRERALWDEGWRPLHRSWQVRELCRAGLTLRRVGVTFYAPEWVAELLDDLNVGEKLAVAAVQRALAGLAPEAMLAALALGGPDALRELVQVPAQ
jgi:hypothetical protein